MHIETVRPNVLAVTLTTAELGALVAAARMSLEVMRNAPDSAPREGVELLERVLHDFDDARSRLSEAG